MSTRLFALQSGFWGLPIPRPPIPHEHGAWMMLYTPILIVIAAAGSFSVPSALLIIAVTSAFLGQNAAGLLNRRVPGEGIRFWLGLNLTILGAICWVLLLTFGFTDLVWVGFLAGVLFVRQVLWVWSKHKKIDHSLWGEIVSVSGLSLTAPAAYVVSHGALDGIALGLWIACILYFSSSVFYVKLRVSAARTREAIGPRIRWSLGRSHLFYHVFLAAVLAAAVVTIGGLAAVLLSIAFLPILVRALWGWARLSNHPPSLKRIGVGETCYTLWFAGFIGATLSLTF